MTHFLNSTVLPYSRNFCRKILFTSLDIPLDSSISSRVHALPRYLKQPSINSGIFDGLSPTASTHLPPQKIIMLGNLITEFNKGKVW